MTLLELSVQYRDQAQILRGRIRTLEAQIQGQVEPSARLLLVSRINLLRVMWREARDLAVLTQRYYERGYRRNERYTL